MGSATRQAYRVYEAEQPGLPGPNIRISVSVEREPALLEEISLGRRLLRLVRLVLETDDPGLARRSAERHFF